jgi:hypothetical protein
MSLYYFTSVRRYVVEKKILNLDTNEREIVEFEKFKVTYVGVLSPFCRDYSIMTHDDKREAIFHTEHEMNRVKDLLDRHNVDYIINQVTKPLKERKSHDNIALDEIIKITSEMDKVQKLS